MIMNDDIDSNELERQLEMLEGLNLEPSVPLNNLEQTNNLTAAQVQTTVQPSVTQVQQQAANDFAAAQVVQPTVTQPVINQPIINQPVVQPVVESKVPETADINAAPVFVNLGESTYETKTDFLKLKDGESTRVTLINYNAVAVHEHFKEGLGYFRCKSTYEPGQRWPAVRAICCQQPNKNDPSKLENAGYKILLPVIEYPVNHNDGKTLVAGGVPKLKVIKLSQQEYNSLEAIKNEYGVDTSTFDISINRKKDTNGFLKYFLTPGPSWRTQFNQAIQEESLKLNNETYTTAIDESAKDISVEKLQQFFNEQRQQEQMAAQFANQPLITDPKSLGLNI